MVQGLRGLVLLVRVCRVKLFLQAGIQLGLLCFQLFAERALTVLAAQGFENTKPLVFGQTNFEHGGCEGRGAERTL